jgi:hypothetical protein
LTAVEVKTTSLHLEHLGSHPLFDLRDVVGRLRPGDDIERRRREAERHRGARGVVVRHLDAACRQGRLDVVLVAHELQQPRAAEVDPHVARRRIDGEDDGLGPGGCRSARQQQRERREACHSGTHEPP